MKHGQKGMGMHKHGVSGRGGKSPRLRHIIKLEAERNERKDKSRIKNPKSSVRELINSK